MEKQKFRIAFTGSAGTGKTTLGQSLSTESGVPFLNYPTQIMQDKYNLSSHSDIINSSSSKNTIKFQTELIENRYKYLKEQHSFITDRSVIDSFIYYYIHNSFFSSQEEFDRLLNITIKSINNLDFIFILKTGNIPLIDNSIRTVKDFYQELYEYVLLSTINNKIKSDRIIVLDNFPNKLSERVSFILNFLEKNNG